jgi:hypothetical protein
MTEKTWEDDWRKFARELGSTGDPCEKFGVGGVQTNYHGREVGYRTWMRRDTYFIARCYVIATDKFRFELTGRHDIFSSLVGWKPATTAEGVWVKTKDHERLNNLLPKLEELCNLVRMNPVLQVYFKEQAAEGGQPPVQFSIEGQVFMQHYESLIAIHTALTNALDVLVESGVITARPSTRKLANLI